MSDPGAAPAAVGAAPAADDGGGPAKPARARIAVVVSVVVLAVVLLVLAFFVGSRLGAPAEVAAPAPAPTASNSPTPSPTPAPTLAAEAPAPVAAPAGLAAPGLHEWTELSGGECIDPYTSPWERQFQVVDCAVPHHAQLLVRGTYPGDASAPYPGEAALTSGLNLACTDASVLDLGTAGIYADLQLQPAYPANEEQWSSGDRSYYCFASRSGGDVLAGSLRPPA